MYIRNNTVSVLEEVSVRVESSSQFGEVTIGTEYPADAGLNAANALYVEKLAIQRGGTMLLGARPEENVADYVDFVHHGGPFLRAAYEPIKSAQVSDGALTQLASQLADENDSTNVLAAVSWGDTISWNTLAIGGFVSVWVKRHIPAGVSGGAQELDKFELDIRFMRRI